MPFQQNTEAGEYKITEAEAAADASFLIVAGWDKEVGPSVYNIPLGGGLFKQPWAIGGSGSTYVYGYCDATYRDGMNRDETVEFVKNSMSQYL